VNAASKKKRAALFLSQRNNRPNRQLKKQAQSENTLPEKLSKRCQTQKEEAAIRNPTGSLPTATSSF